MHEYIGRISAMTSSILLNCRWFPSMSDKLRIIEIFIIILPFDPRDRTINVNITFLPTADFRFD